jgi:hypothetical protein
MEVYNTDMSDMPKRITVKQTSTIAVNTDSVAFEPDFQVRNPMAGMVWPLNSLNDSA